MLDLSNIFNKDIKKAILSKEQLAEMLKVTPEALEAFERSYQLHSMNDSTISDNLFKVNAKQAAGMNPKLDLSEKDIVQELIDQIVKELLAQVVMYSYDGNKGVFVDIDTKEILGMNPYWGPAVMKQRFGKEADANDPDMVHDYVIYSAHEETLMKRYQENKKTVYNEVENLLPFLNLRGQWSMDIMQNGEDFYIIDMALAKDSALQSCVPKGMIKAVKEDWIPRISENYWPSERD